MIIPSQTVLLDSHYANSNFKSWKWNVIKLDEWSVYARLSDHTIVKFIVSSYISCFSKYNYVHLLNIFKYYNNITCYENYRYVRQIWQPFNCDIMLIMWIHRNIDKCREFDLSFEVFYFENRVRNNFLCLYFL